MIASVRGVLVLRDPEGIVIETPGGTGYHIQVSIGVFERLPAVGHDVRLDTELVVREDGWSLFGFDHAMERMVFQRLMSASGVGPRLALAILSTLGPDRTVRAVRDRDLAALGQVPGIGRKKAERIALELGDRLNDLPATEPVAAPSADAVRALVGLGYPAAAAEAAVRAALDGGASHDTAALVRRALQEMVRK